MPASVFHIEYATRQAWPGRRIVLVFEPHRFTRTRDLLDDFAHGRTAATSLEHVDEFIYQTDWSLLHPDPGSPVMTTLAG